MENFINFFTGSFFLDKYLYSSMRELINLIAGLDFITIKKVKSPSILRVEPYLMMDLGGELDRLYVLEILYENLQLLTLPSKIAISLNVFFGEACFLVSHTANILVVATLGIVFSRCYLFIFSKS